MERLGALDVLGALEELVVGLVGLERFKRMGALDVLLNTLGEFVGREGEGREGLEVVMLLEGLVELKGPEGLGVLIGLEGLEANAGVWMASGLCTGALPIGGLGTMLPPAANGLSVEAGSGFGVMFTTGAGGLLTGGFCEAGLGPPPEGLCAPCAGRVTAGGRGRAGGGVLVTSGRAVACVVVVLVGGVVLAEGLAVDATPFLRGGAEDAGTVGRAGGGGQKRGFFLTLLTWGTSCSVVG